MFVPPSAVLAAAFPNTQVAVPEWPDDEYLASIDPSPALLVKASASDSIENLEVRSRNSTMDILSLLTSWFTYVFTELPHTRRVGPGR